MNHPGETIAIVDYQPEHAQAFKDLNVEWITTYWELEAPDLKALDHPVENIIHVGGAILIALYKQEAIGTVALIPHDPTTLELAKMAVSPKVQGLGAGQKLGDAAIERAKAMGAARLYLETNTILKPAISLYHKLGFQEIKGATSPYERCNFQMELFL